MKKTSKFIRILRSWVILSSDQGPKNCLYSVASIVAGFVFIPAYSIIGHYVYHALYDDRLKVLIEDPIVSLDKIHIAGLSGGFLIWVLAIINHFISVNIRNKRVTDKGYSRKKDRLKNDICWVLKLKNGEIIPFQEYTWGKGKRHLIRKGVNFMNHPRSYKGGIKDFYLQFDLPIEWNGSKINLIDAKIHWVINKEFNLYEISKMMLTDNPKNEVLYLDDYLKSLFMQINKSRLGLLEDIYKNYIADKITSAQMLKSIAELLYIPKVFSNAKKASISMGIKKEEDVYLEKEIS